MIENYESEISSQSLNVASNDSPTSITIPVESESKDCLPLRRKFTNHSIDNILGLSTVKNDTISGPITSDFGTPVTHQNWNAPMTIQSVRVQENESRFTKKSSSFHFVNSFEPSGTKSFASESCNSSKQKPPSPKKFCLISAKSKPNQSEQIGGLEDEKTKRALPDCQISNETIVTTDENPSDIELSQGNISLSPSIIKSKALSTTIVTPKCGYKLHFSTDNLDAIFQFKYAFYLTSLFGNPIAETQKTLTKNVMKSIQALLLIVNSFESPLVPLFVSFGKYTSYNSGIMYHKLTPFYFFYTTISYLLRTNGNSEIEEWLHPLLKSAFERIITNATFSSSTWEFLRTFVKKHLGNSKRDEKNRAVIRYDMFTVQFIYNEMKFGTKTKAFFTKIWEACKVKCRPICTSIELCSQAELFIPWESEYRPYSFEQKARKLYQIKLTEILFSEWKSIDNLLSEYSQFKADFKRIIVDFRLGIFSRNDFTRLHWVLVRIQLFLIDYSPKEIVSVYHFLIELEYFVIFKSLLFAHDFCIEFHRDMSIRSYERIFGAIKSIDESFDEIYSSLHKKGFKVNRIKFVEIQRGGKSCCFGLENFINSISRLLKIVWWKSFDSINEELKRLAQSYTYFQENFTDFKNLTRFECAEFIGELEEIIASNNLQRINEVFSARKYEILRELWSLSSTELPDSTSLELRKQYLIYFRKYLIFYNQ